MYLLQNGHIDNLALSFLLQTDLLMLGYKYLSFYNPKVYNLDFGLSFFLGGFITES
jgi:hypothetical protein